MVVVVAPKAAAGEQALRPAGVGLALVDSEVEDNDGGEEEAVFTRESEPRSSIQGGVEGGGGGGGGSLYSWCEQK